MKKIFIFLIILKAIIGYLTSPPVWVTSAFFQAGNENIINSLTTNNVTPTHTFTFVTAFSSIPYLGYGIKDYEGGDYFSEQKFEIYRTGLTAATFTVAVQIVGFTNLWRVNVPYLAISPDFPHNIISFDNVPVNFSAGALTGITTKVSSMTTYQNTINFTIQAGSNSYNTFEAPLSSHKIVLLMTSLFLDGTNEARTAPSSDFNPIDVLIDATILSDSEYKIKVQLGVLALIERLHFSQIIFDTEDIKNSLKYVIFYDTVQIPTAGAFYQIPQQFVNNFIIGLVDFSAIRTRAILHSVVDFTTENGIYGLKFQARVGRPTSSHPDTVYTTVNRIKYDMIYLKTWLCLDPTPLFDEITQQCAQCPVANCLVCSSVTVCHQCDTANNYAVSPTGTCTQCDTANNYFANPTTKLCQLCSLSNCITCSSLTQCLVCNIANNYMLDTVTKLCIVCPVSGCIQCDNANNQFYNSTANQCETCSLADCITCQSLTQCSVCNVASNKVLNPATKLCVSCPLSNCLQCQDIDKCQTCDEANGFFLNPTSKLCGGCPVANCLTCATSTTCSVCNEAGGYFLNPSTNLCVSCPVTNCLTCATFSTCSICNQAGGYFLNPSTNLCVACPVPNCLTCLTQSTCSICNQASDYFLNTTDNLCIPCQVQNCLDCQTVDQCNSCDETSNYFLNQTDNSCEYCQVENCTLCAQLYQCQICNESINYFLNFTTNQCDFCMLDYCLECQSLIECEICDESSGYFLNVTSGVCVECPVDNCVICSAIDQCLVCKQVDNYFMNPVDKQCIYCPVFQCDICSAIGQCSLCNESNRYFLNGSTKQCEECQLQQCVLCQSLIQCQLCNQTADYFVNQTSKICEQCQIENCIDCAEIDKCFECNQTIGYFASQDQSQCVKCQLDYCLQCQAYNQCLICDASSEYCLNTNNLKCEPCQGMLNISVTEHALKSGCNMFSFVIYSENFIFTEQQIQNQGKFQQFNYSHIKATIDDNINQCTIQVTISADSQQPVPNQLNFILPNNQIISVINKSMLPLILQSQQQCKNSQTASLFFQAFQIASYIILFFSCLASCKIVGLQLFGVLQLAYFNLADHDFWGVYLQPLSQVRQLHGYNVKLFEEIGQNLPNSVQQLDISLYFLNNVNVMLFILYAVVIVGGVMMVVAKFQALQKNHKVYQISNLLLKQILITLVLFNLMNLCFSAGISWSYSSEQEPIISKILLYITCIGIISSIICTVLLSESGYGQFKNKFKPNCICKAYIGLYIIYRIILGIYMSSQIDYEQGTIIIISFSLFYNLYFAVNQPFKDFYQNYRAGLIYLTEFSILLITNYYRSMKSTTPILQKIYINQPALIQIGLLLLCIIVSFVVLLYQIISSIKKWKKERIQKIKIKNSANISQGSIWNGSMQTEQVS